MQGPGLKGAHVNSSSACSALRLPLLSMKAAAPGRVHAAGEGAGNAEPDDPMVPCAASALLHLFSNRSKTQMPGLPGWSPAAFCALGNATSQHPPAELQKLLVGRVTSVLPSPPCCQSLCPLSLAEAPSLPHAPGSRVASKAPV